VNAKHLSLIYGLKCKREYWPNAKVRESMMISGCKPEPGSILPKRSILDWFDILQR